MADPWLREMTASEPLSIDEEYAMQESWRDDADKLTFIILDRSGAVDGDGDGTGGGGEATTIIGAADADAAAAAAAAAGARADAALGTMAGDVNLFFNVGDEPRTAEVEVMVAEPAARRRGLAAEALRLLASFAARHARLRVDRLVAKIGDANAASLALFGSKLGFARVSHCDVFKETTLELRLDAAALAAIEAPLQEAGVLAAAAGGGGNGEAAPPAVAGSAAGAGSAAVATAAVGAPAAEGEEEGGAASADAAAVADDCCANAAATVGVGDANGEQRVDIRRFER